MKQELDAALVRDFPLLYADRHKSMRETAMCWGFPGDGWEPLIRRLSEKLEKMIAALEPDPDIGLPRASHVKEKFGTLRFYMTHSTDEMEDAIREAELESAQTCEHCGATGTTGGRGWIRTLCEPCRSNHEA